MQLTDCDPLGLVLMVDSAVVALSCLTLAALLWRDNHRRKRSR